MAVESSSASSSHGSGELARELAPAAAQARELRLELGRELLERCLATADEGELALDVRDRRLDDAEPLLVTRILGPAPTQCRARLLCLGELDELLECQPEQSNMSLLVQDFGVEVWKNGDIEIAEARREEPMSVSGVDAAATIQCRLTIPRARAIPRLTAVCNLSRAFLTLLVQELQNQDPTAPMDSTQMVGQIISLNQLDQLASMIR